MVGFLQIVLMTFGLAMDVFVESISTGTSGRLSNQLTGLRLVFRFGRFQPVMLILGWLLGINLLSLISAPNHWVASFFLFIVGFRMIR